MLLTCCLNLQVRVLGSIAVGVENVPALVSKLGGLDNKSAAEIQDLYNVNIHFKDSID
jgi:hypothetical protein